MNTERVLIELSLCEDPLCGVETFQLVEVLNEEFFIYLVRDPMQDEREVARTAQRLTDEEIYELVEQSNWFNSSISLENADITSVTEAHRLLEGDWPIFTVGGSMTSAAKRFRNWAESWALYPKVVLYCSSEFRSYPSKLDIYRSEMNWDVNQSCRIQIEGEGSDSAVCVENSNLADTLTYIGRVLY